VRALVMRKLVVRTREELDLAADTARRARARSSVGRCSSATMSDPPSLGEPSHWASSCESAWWLADNGVFEKKPLLLRKTNRWPQLNGTDFWFLTGWINFMHNFVQIEALSVAAYLTAVLGAREGDHVVDVGANAGFYTVLAAKMARNAYVTAVDMQPRCRDLVECHLALNRVPYSPRVRVMNRYVSDGHGAASSPIRTPLRACNSMASPTAPGGRRPDGRLRQGQNRLNVTNTTAVFPLDLGLHLRRRIREGARVAAVKIDTEGFEPRVLESLRPVWHLMGDVVIELQPCTWAHHRINTEAALATLIELGRANDYVVVTLPHLGARDSGTLYNKAVPSLVDPCLLEPIGQGGSGATYARALAARGLRRAQTMSFAQLAEALRFLIARQDHAFHEALFTRRRSSCADVARASQGRSGAAL
jgi:FkbM family methyltransferase